MKKGCLCFALFCIGLLEAGLQERITFIHEAVEKIICEADPGASVGIEAFSIKEGEYLCKRGENLRLIPASNTKLFVAAAALNLLGPDYSFETQIFTNGPLHNGKLQGDCYLVGGGDPTLESKDLDGMILQLSNKGIEAIEGDLVLDLEEFDDEVLGQGWMAGEEPAFWNAPLSALTVQHNCVEIKVGPIGTSLNPKIDYLRIDNQCLIGKETIIEIKRQISDCTTVFTLQGSIAAEEEEKTFLMPIPDPPSFAADLLKMFLQKNRITLFGQVRIGKCPEGSHLLALHRSRPLAEVLTVMLKNSDNLYANCLFKKMGRVKYGKPGTWQKGRNVVQEFLAESVGIENSQYCLMDGDGQSRYNLVSPHQMVQLLRWVKEYFPHAAVFKTALPKSGIDGTLKRRMDGFPFQGKIQAKTGTMTGVSSLSGYLETQDGEEIVFAIFINGFIKSAKRIREEIEDPICKTLFVSGL
jgi:D-alanyl-D-alanine carboxypeptidase/D-alanyl-D-alanine-endopeptidase (penicillin-binding protein 4)